VGTPAQAADVPLDGDAGAGDDAEDVAEADEADDFESDPVEDEVEAEPDAFADEDDGVLPDDDPRLSFR
jgi:hypothetical protein